MQDALETKLHFSTVLERTIQTLEDMLKAYFLQFKGSVDERLSLIEFAYNNNDHSSIGMTPLRIYMEEVVGCQFTGKRSVKESCKDRN